MSVSRHGCSREVCELVANLNHNHPFTNQPTHIIHPSTLLFSNPPQPSAHPSTLTRAICAPVHSPIYPQISIPTKALCTPIHTPNHTSTLPTLLCLTYPPTHPFTHPLYTSRSCQMSSHIITRHPFRIQN